MRKDRVKGTDGRGDINGSEMRGERQRMAGIKRKVERETERERQTDRQRGWWWWEEHVYQTEA